jgi:antirestriction protein ArdC
LPPVFHELGHWTGAKHRLDRDLSNRFETKDQKAAEELIAELTSAFLCAEFSIDGSSEHSSYIAHWITLLKSDPKAIFTCASQAQAAVDFMRDLVLREPAQAAE